MFLCAKPTVLIRLFNFTLATLFTVSFSIPSVFAQSIAVSPSANMVQLSAPMQPMVLRGMEIHPDNPLVFDFMVDQPANDVFPNVITQETTKLVKYFLATLSISEKDLWVNLSPNEPDRIIAQKLGQTDLGRDMLAQDYLLKRITSSLIYPESEVGRKFWDKVYKKANQKYGTINVDVDTFNKVWIVPEKGVVYTTGNKAFVVESRLKVMMEKDYRQQTVDNRQDRHSREGGNLVGSPTKIFGDDTVSQNESLSTEIMREVVIPVLEEEVNNGANFAPLRQVFNSLILAKWYKSALKESLLNQVLNDSNKVEGIDIQDKQVAQRIYQKYLKTYEEGVYNFVKEELDSATGEMIPRKYFSGGVEVAEFQPTAITGTGLSKDHKQVLNGNVYVIPFAKRFVTDVNVSTDKQLTQTVTATESTKELVEVDAALVAADYKAKYDELQASFAEHHNSIVDTITNSDHIPMLGKLDYKTVLDPISDQVRKIKDLGAEHIIIYTQDNPTLAELFLQVGLKTPDWNIWFKKNDLPQIHIVDSQKAHDRVHEEINFTETNLVTFNGIKWKHTKAGVDQMEVIEQHTSLSNELELGLFAASLVEPSYAFNVLQGASEAFNEWKQLENPDEYQAYELGAAPVAFAENGNNVTVLNMYGKKYRELSVWQAHQMNRFTGDSDTNFLVKGEWASDFRHSTFQGQAQSIGNVPDGPFHNKIKEAEEKGFMGIVNLNANEGANASKAVVQGGSASSVIEGFRHEYLLDQDRESQRVGTSLVGRHVVNHELKLELASDLGRRLHEAQVAALMTAKLSGANLDNYGTEKTDLELAIEREPDVEEVKEIKSEEVKEHQNILSIDDGGIANGVLGNYIFDQYHEGNRAPLDLLIKMAAKLTDSKAGLGKLASSIAGGNDFVHMNPDKTAESLEEIFFMAQRFKHLKRIYVAAVGGSVTGDVLVRMLKLIGGPEVIYVTDYDGHRMEEIQEDIKENHKDTGLVMISKSGVTRETSANGLTMLHELKENFKATGEFEDHKKNVLLITDPKLGDLRKMAKDEGYYTLDHPEHGGRFSMFSPIGGFFYALKGGENAKAEYEEAIEQWRKQLDKFFAISKSVNDDYKALLNLNLDKIKALETEAEITKALQTLSKLMGREINALSDLPGQTEFDQKQLVVINKVMTEVAKVPGATFGFLRTLINTIHHTMDINPIDTEVALSFNPDLMEMYAPDEPLYPQLKDESLGKPGVRIATSAVAGMNNINEVWDRLMSNEHAYISLHAQRFGNNAAKDEKIRRAIMKEATAKGKFAMSTTTGAMDITSALMRMQSIYMELEVSAMMYAPMQVNSQGQDGVELPKLVVEAISKGVIEGFDEDTPEARAKHNKVPTMDISQVDQMGEIEFEISTDPKALLSVNAELANVATSLIKGSEANDGLASVETRDNLEYTANPRSREEILRNLIANFVGSNDSVVSAIIDGKKEKDGVGEGYVVVARSIESQFNLLTGTSNGTTIEFYKKDELGNFTSKPALSIKVQWGSNVRVFVSNGRATQDYRLMDDNRLVEVSKPGDHNLISLSDHGKYVSFGGESTARPPAFQNLDNDILQDFVKTKVRQAGDATTPNMNLMFLNQGLMTGFVTWSEAAGLALQFEGAGGYAMVMTESGLEHVSNMELTEEQLLSQDKVYVYAGVEGLMRQVQLMLDILNAKEKDGSETVFRILEGIKKVPADASAEMKASAIMFLLRLQEGLEQLPGPTVLQGKVAEMVARLRKESKALLEQLDEEAVVAQLREKYLELSLTERENSRDKFTLLGSKDAHMRSFVESGDETRELYNLEAEFSRQTIGAIFENINQQFGTTFTDDEEIFSAIKTVHQDHKANMTTQKHEKVNLPELEFKEELDEYWTENLKSIDPLAGVPKDAQRKLLEDAKQARDIILNAYLNPTDITELYKNGDAKQREIIDKLAAREKGLIKTGQDGRQILDVKSHVDDILRKDRERQKKEQEQKFAPVNSLRHNSRNLPEQKFAPEVNTSGDTASRLDFIFNSIFNFTLRANPSIFAIISEEDDKIVYGIGRKSGSVDEYQLIVMSDPIDGSSNVRGGNAYGSIFTFGFLKPGQTIEDGDMNLRSQFLTGFKLQFSHTTQLILVNPYNKNGSPEGVVFGLDRDQKFKKLFSLESLWKEEGKKEWNGFEPKINKDPNAVVHLAFGGSFQESDLQSGLREHIRDTKVNRGYVDAYGGALLNDIMRLVLASHYSNSPVEGVEYNYEIMGGKPRLRHPFEGWFMAWLFKSIFGEVTNGREPLFNVLIKGEEPSGIGTAFQAASTWLTKKRMAWHWWVTNKESGDWYKTVEGSKAARARFQAWYTERGTTLVKEVAKNSKSYGEEKTELEVIKAYLDFDSLSMQPGEYAPTLLDLSPEEFYNKVFDNAMKTKAEEIIANVQQTMSPDVFEGYTRVAGELAEILIKRHQDSEILAVIDGISGGGKSTLTAFLYAALEAKSRVIEEWVELDDYLKSSDERKEALASLEAIASSGKTLPLDQDKNNYQVDKIRTLFEKLAVSLQSSAVIENEYGAHFSAPMQDRKPTYIRVVKDFGEAKERFLSKTKKKYGDKEDVRDGSEFMKRRGILFDADGGTYQRLADETADLVNIEIHLTGDNPSSWKVVELDSAMNVKSAAPVVAEKTIHGGIDLGKSGFLEVKGVSDSGQLQFDPAQLHQIRTNLQGVVPVPLSAPVLMPLAQASGITPEPSKNVQFDQEIDPLAKLEETPWI